MPGNRNAAIIKAIVTLAETLGMETTAEGVETQDELELIRELGCSHIQGYRLWQARSRADDVHRSSSAQPSGIATAQRLSRSAARRAPRCCAPRGSRSARRAATSASATSRRPGAMIDGIESTADADGVDVQIELLEDQMFPARIRWARDGKAGIEFDEAFNLERLNQGHSARLRRTG